MAEKKQIIACRSLQPEIDYLLAQETAGEICATYLEQALHRTPDRLPQVLQSAIDEVSTDVSTIVLGYGL